MNNKLVKKAIDGDRVAFENLVMDTKDELYKFCVYLTHQQNAAEDLCQTTIVKALEHIQELKNPSSFKSWLFQIAKYHFYNQRTSAMEKFKVPLDTKIEEKLLCFNHMEDSHIRAVMNQLCPKERMTILLIDLFDYSYDEVALLMGVTKASVRCRLFRARKEFISLFRQYNWLNNKQCDEIEIDSDSTKIIKIFQKKTNK